MNISDYLRTALLNHGLGVANFVKPATVWAGLYTNPPTSAGGGTEVGTPDYQRVATAWNPAVLGAITNSQDIRFPGAGQTTSNWGNVVSLGLFDTSIGGNLLFFGPLSAVISLGIGGDFRIATAQLAIGLD